MASNRKNCKNLDWALAFDQIQQKAATTPKGDGWHTMKEIKQQLKVGDNRLSAFITNACESGKMESFEGTAVGVHGKLVRRVWYRLKE